MASRFQIWLSRRDRLYFALATTFGLLMALLNPPFVGVPDEHHHYWKAWAVAYGELKCGPGSMVPGSALELPSSNFPVQVEIPGLPDRKVSLERSLKRLFDVDAGGLVPGGRVVCGPTPLGHLPPAFGLRLGRALGLSPAGDLYLARVCNLLVSVALVSLAIRLIPFGKIVLLVIGLLPMTLQQFASLSYDGMHIALCFLFTAAVLKLSGAPDEPAAPKALAWLLLLGALAFNVKLGYVGLALLVFLLPFGKFRTRREYWVFTAGFVAVQALCFVAIRSAFAPAGGGGSSSVRPDVDAAAQIAHVLAAPLDFLVVLYDTLSIGFRFYLETFLYKPGWLTHSLPPWLYLFLLAGMFLLLRNEDEAVDLTVRQRFVLLFVFLVNFGVVFLALYVGWTAVGQKTIEGVQGRYLLGIAPLLVLFFYKADFGFRLAYVRRHLAAILVCFYLAVFGLVFLHIYAIFYDKRPQVALTAKIVEKLFGR